MQICKDQIRKEMEPNMLSELGLTANEEVQKKKEIRAVTREHYTIDK